MSMCGMKHSEESRQKMSERAMGHPNRNVLLKGCFTKGQASWNKGKEYQIGQGRYVRKPEHIEVLRKNAFKRGHFTWNKGIRGSKSHSWEGGKTEFSQLIRHSDEYYNWRASVYRRDGWTCQTCGYRGHGKDIDAHHIVTLKQLIKETWVEGVTQDEQYVLTMAHPKMFDISNGVTLCEPCHILTYKGKKK